MAIDLCDLTKMRETAINAAVIFIVQFFYSCFFIVCNFWISPLLPAFCAVFLLFPKEIEKKIITWAILCFLFLSFLCFAVCFLWRKNVIFQNFDNNRKCAIWRNLHCMRIFCLLFSPTILGFFCTFSMGALFFSLVHEHICTPLIMEQNFQKSPEIQFSYKSWIINWNTDAA